MAKVGIKLGFTYRVGDLSTNQYGRIDVDIHDIDTELPLDSQLKESTEYADEVFKVVKQKIDTSLDEILGDVDKGKGKNE
jgi:N-formylglutamate amidohydrolase